MTHGQVPEAASCRNVYSINLYTRVGTPRQPPGHVVPPVSRECAVEIKGKILRLGFDSFVSVFFFSSRSKRKKRNKIVRTLLIIKALQDCCQKYLKAI